MGDGALGLVKLLVVVVVIFMALGAFPELLRGGGFGTIAWIAIGLILIGLVFDGSMTLRRNLFSGVLVTMIVVFVGYGFITRSWEELKNTPGIWSRMIDNAKRTWDNADFSDRLSFTCLFFGGPACSEVLAPLAAQNERGDQKSVDCLWGYIYDYDRRYNTGLGEAAIVACRNRNQDYSTLDTCLREHLRTKAILEDTNNTCLVGRDYVQPR